MAPNPNTTMSPSPRDNWYLAQGDECSSGSASKRSLYATYTHTYWKNEKYKRDTPQHKSKWAKRKAKRVLKKKLKGFYGYKKEAVKLNWIKHTYSQGAKNGKKEIVMGWKHPIQNYIIWYDSKPKPVTGYRWVSTAKPGNDEWVQRFYPQDKHGDTATAMGLMSKRGPYQYDYVPPPEPVKKKIELIKI